MPMDTKLGKVLTLSERLPPYDPLITWTIWNHLTNQKNYISIWRGLKLKRLSRHWLFANFEIVFYFAANLSSCFNDGGAAFYYERFYTFQWVLTQRNCPLKWFWDNPLNKWLSVSLLISMQWNPNFPTLTIQYDHCPWLKTFLQKMWVITNRSTIHHDPPRSTTTKKYPPPISTTQNKPTTTQKIPRTTYHHPKNTNYHSPPPKICSPPSNATQKVPTTTHHHSQQNPTTCHNPPLPKIYPLPLTTTTHHPRKNHHYLPRPQIYTLPPITYPLPHTTTQYITTTTQIKAPKYPKTTPNINPYYLSSCITIWKTNLMLNTDNGIKQSPLIFLF